MKHVVRIMYFVAIFLAMSQQGYPAFNKIDYELENATLWADIDRMKAALEKGPTQKGLNNSLRNVFWTKKYSRKIETVYAMIDLLISRGADINQKNSSGHPLLLDLVGINPALLDYVLEKGGKSTISENGGSKFINRASFLGLPENISVLLKYGAKLDAKSGEWSTPLHSAAIRGDANNIKAALFLLKKGVPINAADGEGWTPLMITSRNGHYDFANMLLENGADPNIKSKKGHTALSVVKAYHLWFSPKKDSFNVEKYRKLSQLLITHGAKEGTRYTIQGNR